MCLTSNFFSGGRGSRLVALSKTRRQKAQLHLDELEGSEQYSVYGEDSDEEDKPKVRKAKRARSTVPKPKGPRKKYVRGKQGGLQGMMKMPLEIFTEVRRPSV